MQSVYVTFDRLDPNNGAGLVCLHELRSLQSVSECHVIEQKDIHGIKEYGFNPFIADYFAARAYTGPEGIDILHLSCSPGLALLDRIRPKHFVVNCPAHDLKTSIAEHERYFGKGSYKLIHNTDEYLHEKLLQHAHYADAVITPSFSSAKWIEENIKPKRIQIISHGCSIPDIILPFPSEFRVGYLGAFGPDKSLHLLLLAWKYFEGKGKLVFGGNCKNGVQWLSQQLDIPLTTDRYELTGWVNNVSDFYNNTSVYVQPSCFIAGTPVTTSCGIRNIEFLTTKEKVLTQDGTERIIEKLTKRYYKGKIIKISVTSIEQVFITPDHLVFCIKRGLTTRKLLFQKKMDDYNKAIKLHSLGIGGRNIARSLNIKESTVNGWIYYHCKPEGLRANHSSREDISTKSPEWISSKNLEEGDILLVPRIKECLDISSIKVDNYITRTHSNNSTHLPDSIELNSSFLKLIGYFISEGCAGLDSVTFCFNRKEAEYIRDTSMALKELGLKTNIQRIDNKAMVRSNCTELSRLLSCLCGKGAHNKKLPYFALNLPVNKLKMIIQGVWRGDGSLYKSKSGMLATSFSTVSRDLVYGVYLAVVKMGYRPCLHNEKTRGFSINITTQSESFAKDVLNIHVLDRKKTRGNYRTWIDENYYYLPVRKTEELNYEGEVYNLSVKGNPTYCVPFLAHNCSEGFGIETIEAMAHGRPVIVSAGAGSADAVTDGVDGFVVPAGDYQSILDKLNYFVSNPDKIAEMGKAAREKAKTLSWDKIESKYVEFYKGIMA